MHYIKIKIEKLKLVYDSCLWIKMLFFSTYYILFLSLFKVFKIKNKKVIIINYNGKGFGDMGKYICKELCKYDYKVYWACKKQFKESLPDKVHYVKYDSIAYLYHLATAKIWINNARFRYGITKRKKQYYIQTWHAGLSYKNVESAVTEVLSKPYILGAKNDSRMANLLISNSKFTTEYMKKYFWYDGEILEQGLPRNDIIVNQDKNLIDKVKQYYNIDKDSKICLYAPTFRANSSLEPYNIDYNTLTEELSKKFGGSWKMLVRLHPNISSLSENLKTNENIIDATYYPDMQELLIATDFMITDYSSCIFDYAISKKPAMIYASDIGEYVKDRNFLIKLEDTPFPIAINNDELKQQIQNFNEKKYKKDVEKFYKSVGLNETGESSKRIVEIINMITKDERK